MARLDAHARALGLNRTTLAERFLEEGLRLVEHPGIIFTTGAEGERRATLAGTRLDVWFVVEAIRANGKSMAETADYLAVSMRLVETAARYYAAYPDEIDREIRLVRDLAERERGLADALGRLLG
jgi:uncharacterized protein (DUF433 family)